MGTEHTFYDYVDDAGENTIYAWFNTIPKAVKQKLNRWLLHLEGINQGSWSRPLVDTLSVGACDGLFEIRAKLRRQQYRILGYHGPVRQKSLPFCGPSSKPVVLFPSSTA